MVKHHGMTDPEGIKWATALSESLKAWCRENERSGEQLRQLIDAPERIWRHILSAESITPRTNIYASVFLLTGIQEADPCFVPSSRSGPRSWTESEYMLWQQSEEAARIREIRKNVLLLPEENFDDNQIDAMIEDLVAILKRQFHVPLPQREVFVRKYGKKLGRLDKFVGTLILPASDRELSIRMTLDSDR